MSGNWKLVKSNTVTVKFKNTKTKQVVVGAKEAMGLGKPKWYPIFVNGQYITDLHASFTKEGIIEQLEKYMKDHP
jgi:hypothetical protein